MSSTTYQPGVCNIGRAEIARRRATGWIGLFATAALWAIMIFAHTAPAFRLLLFLPAAGAAAGFVQARLRFCAGFGMTGVFNFDAVGSMQTVAEDEARRADRRRSFQVMIWSVVIGAVVALAGFFIPV